MLYVHAINESIHHPINKGKFYSIYACRTTIVEKSIIDFRYRTMYHSPLRFLRSEWINFNRPTNNTSLHLLHSKSTLYIHHYIHTFDDREQWGKSARENKKVYTNTKKKGRSEKRNA